MNRLVYVSSTNTIANDNGTEYTLPVGLTARAGHDSYKCDDCRAWEHAGDRLRHGRRCDTPSLQPTTVAVAPKSTEIIADVEVPTVSDGGSIDWSRIRRGSPEWEAAHYAFGKGGGNFDMI